MIMINKLFNRIIPTNIKKLLQKSRFSFVLLDSKNNQSEFDNGVIDILNLPTVSKEDKELYLKLIKDEAEFLRIHNENVKKGMQAFKVKLFFKNIKDKIITFFTNRYSFKSKVLRYLLITIDLLIFLAALILVIFGIRKLLMFLLKLFQRLFKFLYLEYLLHRDMNKVRQIMEEIFDEEVAVILEKMRKIYAHNNELPLGYKDLVSEMARRIRAEELGKKSVEIIIPKPPHFPRIINNIGNKISTALSNVLKIFKKSKRKKLDIFIEPLSLIPAKKESKPIITPESLIVLVKQITPSFKNEGIKSNVINMLINGIMLTQKAQTPTEWFIKWNLTDENIKKVIFSS